MQHFDYFELNEAFQKSLSSVMSHVVLFACPRMQNISIRNGVPSILEKKLYCDFKRSFECNQKNVLDKFSFYRHFKVQHFRVKVTF